MQSINEGHYFLTKILHQKKEVSELLKWRHATLGMDHCSLCRMYVLSNRRCSSGILDPEAETLWKTIGELYAIFTALGQRGSRVPCGVGQAPSAQSPLQALLHLLSAFSPLCSCLVPATCFAHSDLHSVAYAYCLIHYRWDDRSWRTLQRANSIITSIKQTTKIVPWL